MALSWEAAGTRLYVDGVLDAVSRPGALSMLAGTRFACLNHWRLASPNARHDGGILRALKL